MASDSRPDKCVSRSFSTCLCDWERGRGEGKEKSVQDCLHFHMWACVGGYVRTCEWVQWCVSGSATCVFALSSLVEGALNHISACHVPQRNAFNVSKSVQYRNTRQAHVHWKDNFWSPLCSSDHTNSKRMCMRRVLCVSLYFVFIVCRGQAWLPLAFSFYKHTLQTIVLSVSILCIQVCRESITHNAAAICALGVATKKEKKRKYSLTQHGSSIFVFGWHHAYISIILTSEDDYGRSLVWWLADINSNKVYVILACVQAFAWSTLVRVNRGGYWGARVCVVCYAFDSVCMKRLEARVWGHWWWGLKDFWIARG